MKKLEDGKISDDSTLEFLYKHAEMFRKVAASHTWQTVEKKVSIQPANP